MITGLVIVAFLWGVYARAERGSEIGGEVAALAGFVILLWVLTNLPRTLT